MRRRFVPIFAALLLMLGACSSDGGGETSDPTTAQPSAATPTSAPGDAPTGNDGGDVSGLPPGGDGSYSVSGESFDATVYRCEPFTSPGQDPDDRELSVLAFRGGLEGLEVEIGIGTGIGANGQFDRIVLSVFHSRTGESGTEQFEGHATVDEAGDWFAGNQVVTEGLEPLDGVPFEFDGNRLTGGPLTLEQTWPQDGTEVLVVDSWDLEVPGEAWSEC